MDNPLKDLPAGPGGPSALPSTRRPLLVLLYPIGMLLLADQVADLAALLLAQPTNPGSQQWRFVAFGLVTSRTTAFLIGDALIIGAAVALDHRGMLRALGVLHLLLAAGLIAGLGLFSLDTIELRSRVPVAERRRLSSAAARAFLVTALGILLFIWVGIAAIRGTRSRKGRRGRDREGLLVPKPDLEKPQ